MRPENSPLKTVVGQTAHFLVTIDSVNSVPWKSVNWYRIGGTSAFFSDARNVSGNTRIKSIAYNFRVRLRVQMG